VPSPDGWVDFFATKLVRDLRVKFFPLDAGLEAELLATLRDPTLGADPSQNQGLRMSALGDLLSISERRGGLQSTKPAVIRAGAELALVYQEKTGRQAIWGALASTRNPDLVPYLIRGLETVPQAETRLQIVRILAEEFSEDSRAREALKGASRADVQQAVHMIALRKTGGEGKWNEYVVATLKDTGLPDLLRLQPIAEMAPPMSALGPARGDVSPKIQFGDQAIHEIGALIIRASLDHSADDASRNAARKAVLLLGAIPAAAARDALLEILKAPDNLRVGVREEGEGVKSLVQFMLATSFFADPGTRGSIEAMARESAPAEAAKARTTLQIMEKMKDVENIWQQQESRRIPQPR
jgi:hypothetical protein